METLVETPAEVSVALEWLKREPRLATTSVVIPNSLARSKVFSSRPPHVARTVYTTDTELAAWGDDKIYQVGGEQLTQTEESVWLVLVRAALNATIDLSSQNKVFVEFKETDMLRTLDLPVSSQYRTSLRTAMRYLGRARFKMELDSGDRMYEGNLLDLERRTRAGETGYKIWLDMRLSALFLAGWSYLNFEHRLGLRSNPLAQWLLTHYSTHRSPIPIGSALLKKLADRGKMREDKWLTALSVALHELSETTGWVCKLDAKGSVHVTKKDASLTTPVELDPESLDGCLLEAWLATLSMEQLEYELKKVGHELHRVHHGIPPELRNMLRDALLMKPARLERRLAILRNAEEDI